MKAAAIQEELAAAFDDYITTYKAARGLIETCELMPRALLQYRYLLGYSWENVAAKLGITRSYAMRIHKRALEQLAASVLKTY